MSKTETMVYREGHGVIPKSEAEKLDRATKRDNRGEIEYRPVERGSWVYRNGELIPKSKAAAYDMIEKLKKRGDHPSPMVMGDIKEYRNVIDGKPITSRSEHREFLRRHGVEEVGNEFVEPKKALPSKGEIAGEIKETIEQLKAGYVNPDEGVLPAGAEPEMETIEVPSDIKNGDVIRSTVAPE